jgi:uncharacterized protein (TIGR00369 family)
MTETGSDAAHARNAAAFERLRVEMAGPPFHALLQPIAVSADAEAGTVCVQLPFRPELARAPGESSFHGGVIASLIDLTGHAAVAVKIGRMAPTIDLRIDYLRPSQGSALVATARIIRLGRTISRVDIEVRDDADRLIALGRGSFSSV